MEFFSRRVAAVLERPLEVVDDVEDVREGLGQREPEIIGLVLLGAAFQVVEVRRLAEKRLANATPVLFGPERALPLPGNLVLENRDARIRHGRSLRSGRNNSSLQCKLWGRDQPKIRAVENGGICHRLRRFRGIWDDRSHIWRCGLQTYHRLRRLN